jgi:hypothetical protein
LLLPLAQAGDGYWTRALRELVQVKFRAVVFPKGFTAQDFGAVDGLDESVELLLGCGVTVTFAVWW